MQRRSGFQKSFLDELRIAQLANSARQRADWAQRRRSAASWAKAFHRAGMEQTKEKELQGTFLHRMFVDVLGYFDQGSGRELWTLKNEPTTDVDARYPDGSLGFFRAHTPHETKVVIELKDASTDLDAKQLRRRDRLSPVEQAFLYLVSYEDADFAIVSNFHSLRLYSKQFGMSRYHDFNLAFLQDQDAVAVLVGICAAETLLGDSPSEPPPIAACITRELPTPQREITDRFYSLYAVMRNDLVGHLADSYVHRRHDIIEKVQKLLDRLIFIAYAEDVGLLPPRIIARTIEQGRASRARSNTRIWSEFRFLFEDIDKGRSDVNPVINRYNGGLFAHDDFLDSELELTDDRTSEFSRFAEFDFRSEVDVNILGHIFERSIADIELLKRQLSLFTRPTSTVDLSAVDQQRRDLGVFYTPSWVTEFIVDQTLGRFLQGGMPEARKDVRICDPACGSGAFLSEAVSYLASYSSALAAEALSSRQSGLFDEALTERPAQFLNQLYGVDLLAESVEITKLSLWLKTAAVNEPLDSIDNICRANSLVPPTNRDSFWNTSVGEIAKEGRFSVVVGNPPWGSDLSYGLDHFELKSGQFDIPEGAPFVKWVFGEAEGDHLGVCSCRA